MADTFGTAATWIQLFSATLLTKTTEAPEALPLKQDLVVQGRPAQPHAERPYPPFCTLLPAQQSVALAPTGHGQLPRSVPRASRSISRYETTLLYCPNGPPKEAKMGASAAQLQQA